MPRFAWDMPSCFHGLPHPHRCPTWTTSTPQLCTATLLPLFSSQLILRAFLLVRAARVCLATLYPVAFSLWVLALQLDRVLTAWILLFTCRLPGQTSFAVPASSSTVSFTPPPTLHFMTVPDSAGAPAYHARIIFSFCLLIHYAFYFPPRAFLPHSHTWDNMRTPLLRAPAAPHACRAATNANTTSTVCLSALLPLQTLAGSFRAAPAHFSRLCTFLLLHFTGLAAR